jgi:arylsulfatase A-like enzyme
MGAASHWYFRDAFGITQGFDTWDLSAMPGAGQDDTDTTVTAPQLTDAVIRMLGKPEATSGRFFAWVHYFDPHAEYMPHGGEPDFRGEDRGTGSWMRAMYDGEIWFTDKHIGRLLEFVDAQPWGKDTIVVVTADHGECLLEHNMTYHGYEMWEQLLRVPLLVYVPGAEGPLFSPHHVPVKRGQVDLVPTLLDLMRIELPGREEISGTSLLADIEAESADAYVERDVYLDMPDGPNTKMHRGIIHGTTPGMKLVHFGGTQYQLYDLANDPEEKEDLSGDKDKLDPIIQAMQQKRATLKEIYVQPDAPAQP